MSRIHHYTLRIEWTGNIGQGTADYKSYERSHTIYIDGKPDILASSDAPFRGDVSKHNPEDMLLASLSSCHMLWFLHLAADAGVVVTGYTDVPKAVMTDSFEGGAGRFLEAVLHPVVTVTEGDMLAKLDALHAKAHERCFIANSVNFPVMHHAEGVIGNR